MSELFPDAPVTLEAQIECAERELRKRHEVYPRLVAAGKLAPDKSARELLGMRAIIETLQQLLRELGRAR